jgi:hypothetical protein
MLLLPVLFSCLNALSPRRPKGLSKATKRAFLLGLRKDGDDTPPLRHRIEDIGNVDDGPVPNEQKDNNVETDSKKMADDETDRAPLKKQVKGALYDEDVTGPNENSVRGDDDDEPMQKSRVKVTRDDEKYTDQEEDDRRDSFKRVDDDGDTEVKKRPKIATADDGESNHQNNGRRFMDGG